MKVVGLDHVVVVCRDVERTLAWYRDELGLEPVRVDEWRRGDAPFPSVRVSAATIIDLVAGERTGENVQHICLVIEPTDLDALAEQLGTERLDGLYGARGFGSSTYVRDPDGNMIELKAYAS